MSKYAPVLVEHSVPVYSGDILYTVAASGNPRFSFAFLNMHMLLRGEKKSHLEDKLDIIFDPYSLRLTTKMPQTHEITRLLQAWASGDSEAFAKLIPLVDHELKKIAHAYMRQERTGHILQTTALMDEALIRLMETQQISWNDRKHFYSLAAKRMRQVLVDDARKQMAGKRGQRPDQVDLTDAAAQALEAPEQLIMLHDALNKLATVDERKARVVEHRYFGGLTLKEVAEILGVAQITVEREWRLARAWLKREIYGDPSERITG